MLIFSIIMKTGKHKIAAYTDRAVLALHAALFRKRLYDQISRK